MIYGTPPKGPFTDCKTPPMPDVDQNYVTSIDQEPLIGEPLPDRALVRRVLKYYNFAQDGIARRVKLGKKTLTFDEKGWELS